MSKESQFNKQDENLLPSVKKIQHKAYLDELLNKPEDEHPDDIEDMVIVSPTPSTSQRNFLSQRNSKNVINFDLGSKMKSRSPKKLPSNGPRKLSYIFGTQRNIKSKMKFFMASIFLRTIASLTNEKFTYINDQASSYENINNQLSQNINTNNRNDKKWRIYYCSFIFKLTLLYFKDATKQICNLYEQLPTLSKDSKFLIFWTFFKSVIKFLTFYWYTIDQFFYFNNIDCMYRQYHQILHIVLALLLILDIFVSLNKSYISRGILIKSKVLIAKNYFYEDFFYDLLSIIPVFMKMNEQFQKCHQRQNQFNLDLIFYLKLLILFLLRDFHKSIDEVQKQLKMQPKQKMFTDLGRLMLLIIQLIHIFACILKFTADLEINYLNQGNTWLNQYNLQFQEWYVVYIYSFYWGTTIMITVGFGDITPKTTIETFLIICIMVIGCGFFGFSLNKIGAIIQELNKTKQEFQNDVEILGHFLSSKHVESDLMIRSLAYLEYIHSFQDTFEQEKQVLKKLPSVLQEEINQSINQRIIGNFSILKNNFSKSSMEKIMGKVTEIVTAPGELIMDCKSNSQNLYFLLEGQVEKIYQPTQIDNLIESQYLTYDRQCAMQQNKYTSEQISAGKIFGEIEFFGGQPSSYIIRSKSFCKIYFIKRNEFLDIIKYNEDDVEKFQNIQNEINMNNDFSFFGTVCPACLSNQHNLKECPAIHFKLNKVNLVLRSVQGQQQEDKYDRKGKKFPTLLKLCETKYSVNQLISQLKNGSQLDNEISYEDLDDESIQIQENSQLHDNNEDLEFSSEERNYKMQISKDHQYSEKRRITKHLEKANTNKEKSQRTKSDDLKHSKSHQTNKISDLNQLAYKTENINSAYPSILTSDQLIQFSLSRQNNNICLDLDRMKELKFYQNKWNLSNVLKLYNRKTKKIKSQKKSHKFKQLITNIPPMIIQ